MSHTVKFSADVVRARIKALSALQNMMDGSTTIPINSDAAPALNQTIVFAFTRALMHLARYVSSYNMEPENFYTNPSDLLMLEAQFNIPEDSDVNWPVVVKVFEEFMANQVMAEILPSSRKSSSVYSSLASESLQSLLDLFSFSTPIPRLKRY